MSPEKLSVWILGDQLLANHPALIAAEGQGRRRDIQVVLVESLQRSRRLPYQRKKLVLLFSAMRHYAETLRSAGHTVDYLQAPSTVAGLREHVARWQPDRVLTMAASEYRGRRLQVEGLEEWLGVPVVLLPNTQFLTGQHDPYPNAEPDQRVVLEYFYRAMRRYFQVLMTDHGEPEGGQWNYDRENRKPLPRDLDPPPLPSFEPDAITREVMAQVEEANHGVGTVDGFDLAVTRGAAQAAFDDFVNHRLPLFGPYEDAMSSRHATLYHSVISPYINLGLLEPLELIGAVERAYHRGQVPINSAEGFVRQVLGWREYIYWQYWRQMPGLAAANDWQAHHPLPAFFWDAETEMNCMGHALRRALEEGYTHHIERLMLICNFCMLAGVEPMAVNDWFLSAYVDAYEWVMLPNVLGMGLNADGGLTATKPYIASANYINKMGDFCAACRYDHKQRTGADACPFNFLYWNFLLEQEQRLRANPRLGRNVLGLRYLDDGEREQVRREASEFLGRMRESPDGWMNGISESASG